MVYYLYVMIIINLYFYIIINLLFPGEERFSYGFGGTGKASTDCKFTDFGETFGEGDVISCYLVSSS